MGEKWNFGLNVNSPNEELAKEAREMFDAPRLQEMEGVVELEKTAQEAELISGATASTERVLANLGFPPIPVPAERFHVLSRAEMDAKVKPGIRGAAHSGHAYAVRDDLGAGAFAHAVTHELSHLTSYYKQQVNVTVEGEEDIHAAVGMRRGGLAFLQMPVNRAPETVFYGLNEAATEFFAQRLRRDMAPNSALDDAQRARLLDGVSYGPHQMVVRGLIRLVAPVFGSEEAATDALLRDYVAGTNDFLKTLDGVKRGAAKSLLDMGGADADALRAAEALGLAAEADEIRAWPGTVLNVD